MSQGEIIRTYKRSQSQKNNKSIKQGQNEWSSPEQKAKMVILTAKRDLDQVIQQLDSKIKRRIQINECRFMYAYQNHLAKITRQLKLLKQNQQNYSEKFSTDNEITHLGKLCSFFRQEAMRLYTQLQNALTQVQIFKRKSQILQKQLQNSDQSRKRLMASNKNIKNQRIRLKQLVQQKQKTIEDLTHLKLQNQSQNSQCEILKNKSPQKNKGLKIVLPSSTRNSNTRLEDCLSTSKSPKLSHNSPMVNNQNIPLTTKYNSFNSRKNTKFKTMANNDYNRSYRKIDFRDIQSSFHNNLNFDHTYSLNDEADCCEKFLRFIKISRVCTQQHVDTELQSKCLRQLVNSDKDILRLCRMLFRNIKINDDFTIFKREDRQRSQQKSLAYLSTQLMRKFKLPQYIQKQDKIQSQPLDASDLQYINQVQRVKTEVKQRYKDENQKQIEQKRQKSSKQIDATFKRKNTKPKSIVTAFYNVPKTHREKGHLK